MLKFHVTPITPKQIFLEHMQNRNVLISYLNPQDYKRALLVCDKIYIDNGAYTFYRKKIKPDWNKFYEFLKIRKYDYFFIPDVIDGTEEDNDNLIDDCKIGGGIPVFHLHESNERLERLIKKFNYIALGSSGVYWKLGTDKWIFRMNELMKILCFSDGTPKVKIHMLRCLRPELFTQYPFYSGDSSNVAQNHKIRIGGAKKMLEKLEKFNSPEKYTFRDNLYYQMSLEDYL